MRDLLILAAGVALGSVPTVAACYGRRVLGLARLATVDEPSATAADGPTSWRDHTIEDVLEDATTAAKLGAFQREVVKGALRQVYTVGVGDGLTLSAQQHTYRARGA